MKSLFFGIIAIILLGIGGLVYRNALEHPAQPIICPTTSLQCPDGTSVSVSGPSCTFPACPPPNISISDIGIAYAVPQGFLEAEFPDVSSIAAYEIPTEASSTQHARIIIRRFMINASSTALATIQQTAIGSPSGTPVSTTAYSSTVFGGRPFTVVSIERFEGVIDTAYYFKRTTDVLRFDAIDTNVTNWTRSNLDTSTLSAHSALQKLLSTLQVK